MKLLGTLFFIIAFISFYSYAQNHQFVTAYNGLIVREQPELGAKKIGKLNYKQAVNVIEHTNQTLSINEEFEEIHGQWLKINFNDTIGFIFSGFLNSEIPSDIEIYLKNAKLTLYNITEDSEKQIFTLKNKDTLTLEVALGSYPTNKFIKIENNKYKNISLLQRYENSITVMNEGPHCDLTHWKHYNSQWKTINKISNNTYKTLNYSEEEQETFIKIPIEEIKKEVKNYCKDDWPTLITNSKSVNDYPLGVSNSRIFIKIELTEFNNKKEIKIIEFLIPMGC